VIVALPLHYYRMHACHSGWGLRGLGSRRPLALPGGGVIGAEPVLVWVEWVDEVLPTRHWHCRT
jgi:hypothetical protein